MTDLTSSPLVHALGLALVHFLWQGAVIGLFTAIALSAARHAQATTRYAVAGIGLALMAVAPVVTTFSLLQSAGAASFFAAFDIRALASSGLQLNAVEMPSAAAAPSLAIDWSHRLQRWLPAIVLLWLAGVSLLSLRLAYGWMLVARLRRHAIATIAPHLAASMRRVGGAMGLNRRLAIAETTMVDTPTVIGWIRPLLLMPVGLVSGLSPAQLDAILAHEMAHVRRLDPLINGVQTMVETALFYHPAVWWISDVLRREREFVSDDAAIVVVGDRMVYASALASLEEVRQEAPALGVAANGNDLLTRIQRILEVPMKKQRRSAAAAFVGMVAILTPLTLTVARATPPAEQTITRTEAQTRQGQQAEYTAIDRAFVNAIQDRSAATLERVLASDFIGTDHLGMVHTKASLISSVAMRPPTRIEVQQLSIQIAERVVVITGMYVATTGTERQRVGFTRVWNRAGTTPTLASSTEFLDPRPIAAPGTVAGSASRAQTAGRTAGTRQPPARADDLGQPPPPPPPSPPPAGTIRVGGDVKEPKKITNVPPVYPQEAKDAGISGVVILETTLDQEGTVTDVAILRGVPLLNEAAIEAVRQWRYVPTLLNGAPVSLMMTVTVNFLLN